MIPHCSPEAMREHLVSLRANADAQTVYCPECPARYTRNRAGRLLRSRGPKWSWVIVDLGEPPTPSLECPPRLRGAIKGLQQRAGLDDADYRRLLQDVAGVRSSTQLDAEKAGLVARALEDRIAENALHARAAS